MVKTDTTTLVSGCRTCGLDMLRRLKEGCSLLACLLCLVVCSQSADADVQVEKVEQLRQKYEQSRATFAKTKDYGEDYKEKIESGHAFISTLLSYSMTLPGDSSEVRDVYREIKTISKEMAGSSLTERHNIEKSFLARTIWPLLADGEPTSKQAAFMSDLTKPQFSIRMNDRRARAGKPTEPLGWDVQAAYALALVRSGKGQEARNEIAVLHDKVAINHARNPKGKLDYGPEAGAGRFRSYTDYLQLCEALSALQAAISNDRKAATQHIENARKLRETLSPEATPLVTEAARRIKLDQQ